MREIKFRVWDTDEKRFITKSSLQVEGNECCLVLHLDGDLVDIAYDRDERHNEYPVEEFTGLLDKNGKEIYEGDIIRDIHFYKPVEVVWEGNGYWTNQNGFKVMPELIYREIIGNIHEGAK